MRIALWTAPIMKFVSPCVVAAAERESSALADFPREQLGPQAQYEDPLDNTREALAGMDTKIPSCFVPTAADPKQEGIFALSCLFLSTMVPSTSTVVRYEYLYVQCTVTRTAVALSYERVRMHAHSQECSTGRTLLVQL
jgi:hypothetical protein